MSITIGHAPGGPARPERYGGDYAEFLLRQGRYHEAAHLFDECLAAARRRGDQFLVGRYTADAGGLALVDGRPAEALGLFSEGLRSPRLQRALLHVVHFSAPRRDLRRARRKGEGRAAARGADAQVEATELLLWREGIRRREATVAELRATFGEERSPRSTPRGRR